MRRSVGPEVLPTAAPRMGTLIAPLAGEPEPRPVRRIVLGDVELVVEGR